MIANVKWKKCDTFTELLERRPNDGVFWDDTEAAGAHIGEISADYCALVDDDFAMQDDVLAAAQDGLAIYLD